MRVFSFIDTFTPACAHTLQLEQLAAASPKEFLVRCVDMFDARSVSARSRAMVAFCNFLSKGKEGINLDGLSVLLPKLLSFLPSDRSRVMNEAETYLAGATRDVACRLALFIVVTGATAGTICNLCSSSSIRRQCCELGFLLRLTVLISHNDAFSTSHAAGALWNLVVENNGAKLMLAGDDAFCRKLVELFCHSDAQVARVLHAHALHDYTCICIASSHRIVIFVTCHCVPPPPPSRC
jgi:hypothetical protein